MSDSVAKPTAAVLQLEDKRRLPRALMGGTVSMRSEGKVYLPQEPAESKAAYNVRLNRSFLFNGYGKTVKDMASKVFTKPIVVGEDMPNNFEEYAEDIDLNGNNLDVFGFNLFVSGLSDGVTYVLVDMDRVELNSDGTPATLTLEQSRRMNRRPWVVHIQASQVLGWRSVVENGVQKLSQFRFLEEVTEDDGDYGEVVVKQVRVFTRQTTEVGGVVRWEIFRLNKDTQKWALFDEGSTTVSEITVVPVYFNRTGFMMGEPALRDLAEVNLAHWQSQSDQRNILHVARVPILFGAGFDAKSGKMEVGAQRMLTSTDPQAKLGYVEHTGAAIESGRTDLKDLEFQMQVLGLELLIPKPGGQSATGEVIDAAKMNTPLAMMATSVKDAIEQMFVYMALFEGETDPDYAGSIIINTDYGVSLRGAQDTQNLIGMYREGLISRETFITEMKRRGILSEDVDPEEEIRRIVEDEMPDKEESEDSVVGEPSMQFVDPAALGPDVG